MDPKWVDAIEVTATSDEGFPYEAIASAYVDGTGESSELFTQTPAVADGRYTGVIEGSADLPSGAQTGFVLRRGASMLALPFGLPRTTDWLARALPA